MTPQQKELIKASFEIFAAEGDASAALFYARLFEQDASLRSMFTNSMKQQGRKFMDMMSALIHCLDRMDNLVPLLWQMGKRHGGYGVRNEHYAVVQDALLWALEQKHETPLTPETREAWNVLFSLVARTMQQAAEEGSIPRHLSCSPDDPFPATTTS